MKPCNCLIPFSGFVLNEAKDDAAEKKKLSAHKKECLNKATDILVKNGARIHQNKIPSVSSSGDLWKMTIPVENRYKLEFNKHLTYITMEKELREAFGNKFYRMMYTYPTEFSSMGRLYGYITVEIGK